jgi:hypothetical protein
VCAAGKGGVYAPGNPRRLLNCNENAGEGIFRYAPEPFAGNLTCVTHVPGTRCYPCSRYKVLPMFPVQGVTHVPGTECHPCSLLHRGRDRGRWAYAYRPMNRGRMGGGEANTVTLAARVFSRVIRTFERCSQDRRGVVGEPSPTVPQRRGRDSPTALGLSFASRPKNAS